MSISASSTRRVFNPADFPKEIECFLIEPTSFKRRWLRRFRSARPNNKCQANAPNDPGWCDAQVYLDDTLSDSPMLDEPNKPSKDDPRWPTCCQRCNLPFSEDDEYQLFTLRLYTTIQPHAPQLYHTHEYIEGCAPPGAIYLATWNSEWGSIHWQERGGGPHLHVMTPGGWWDVDQKSSNGTGWTRNHNSEAPRITANPSILQYEIDGRTERYHGWLREGKLIRC